MKYARYRFTKQLYKYDCGPAAIVNLMKFTGVKIPYKTSHEKLFKSLKVKETKGVLLPDFHKYLISRKIPKAKFKTMEVNVSYKTLENLLDKGYAAILAFSRGSNVSGHICLIVGYNKCGLEVVNWNGTETIQTVGFDRFRKNVLDFNHAFYYFFERK
jgi:hypothetical protein